MRWDGAGIAAYQWSAIMIIIAMILALFFVFSKRTIAPALVIAWALWGIRASQGPRLALLEKLTTLGVVLILLAVGFAWINSYRLGRQNSR
ncbi:MAG TPA: hypothetical protein DIW54_02870, partial [Chitinophagaceae bacterium]|nr:hypothetical protein [Chitinophagaceae bacterium]